MKEEAKDNKLINKKTMNQKNVNKKQLNNNTTNYKENSKKVISKKQQKKEEKKARKQEKKERRRKSKAWKVFKIILIIFFIALIIFIGRFTYRFIKNGGGLQGFLATAVGHDENTLKDLDKINFLAIGISGYEKDYKLADTIMVCSYDPKTQKASLLSIPRDTYVGKNKQKASASYKINAVYKNGENIDGMIESIEDLIDLQIDNYVIVDTEALVEVVDAIGGVEFDVPIDMKYDDPTQNLHINLKSGYQKLNGQQAEWLVRFRHNNNGTSYPIEYGDNDLGRMRTQREFIQATLKQTLKPENIFNITKILQIAYNNIQTNMKFETIKDYIPYAVNFKVENLKTATLPGTSEQVNGVWIYNINKKQATEVVEELFMDEEAETENDENNTVMVEESNTINTKATTNKTNTTKSNTNTKTNTKSSTSTKNNKTTSGKNKK